MHVLNTWYHLKLTFSRYRVHSICVYYVTFDMTSVVFYSPENKNVALDMVDRLFKCKISLIFCSGTVVLTAFFHFDFYWLQLTTDLHQLQQLQVSCTLYGNYTYQVWYQYKLKLWRYRFYNKAPQPNTYNDTT